MNALQLRTKLSILNIKWTNIPHLYNFKEYDTYLDYNDINLDDLRIIGYIPPQNKRYLHHQILQDSIYLISDLGDTIYLSLGWSHPSMWYKIDISNFNNLLIEKIYDLVQTYDKEDNTEYDVQDYVLLGSITNLEADIKDLHVKLLKSGLVEYLMWGSKYEEYPFDRDNVYFADNKEKIEYISQAMQQKKSKLTISCRTVWSKSLIKISQKMNYINLQVHYNPVSVDNIIIKLNQKHNKNFPIDMPLDLALLLLPYPYINHKQIINKHENVQEIATMLNIMIPKQDRYEFCLNMKYYCHDNNKIEDIKNIL